MRHWLILLIFLANFSLYGCSAVSKTDREIIGVIKANIEAARRERLEEYMATMHEESPVYASTRKIAETLFETYDLAYKIDDAKVIAKSDNEAMVEYVQTTQRVIGPEFRDNKIKMRVILRKSPKDNKWKIYQTIIKSVEFLD